MITLVDTALLTELPSSILKPLVSLFTRLGKFTLRARKLVTPPSHPGSDKANIAYQVRLCMPQAASL